MTRAILAALVAALLSACGAEVVEAQPVPAPPVTESSAEAPTLPPVPRAFTVNATATKAPGALVTRWSLAWSVGECPRVSAVRAVRASGATWRELPAKSSGAVEVDTAGLEGAGPYVYEGVSVEVTCADGRRARSLPVSVDAVRGQGWRFASSVGSTARIRWLSEPTSEGAFWACMDTSGGPRLVELSTASGEVVALSTQPWPASTSWCPNTSVLVGEWLLAHATSNVSHAVLWHVPTRKAVTSGWLYDAAQLPGGDVLVSRGEALERYNASGALVWTVPSTHSASFRPGVVFASDFGQEVVRLFSLSYHSGTSTQTVEVVSIRLSDGARLLTRPLADVVGVAVENGERLVGRLMVPGTAFVAVSRKDRGGRYLASRLLACPLDTEGACVPVALPAGAFVSSGYWNAHAGALAWVRGGLAVLLSDGRIALYPNGTGAPALLPSPGGETLDATASGSLVAIQSGWMLNGHEKGEPTRPGAVLGVTPSGAYRWTWRALNPDGAMEAIAGAIGADGRWWMTSGADLVALHPDNLPE